MTDTDLTGVFHLGRIVRGLMQAHDRALAQEGIDLTAQQLLLLTIAGSRGPTQINQIAEAMGVDPSTTTRMVDRLEDKGLLSRTPSRVDRRATLISLTPDGHNLRAIGVEVTRGVKRSLFTGIDQGDLERFTRVLSTLDARIITIADTPTE